MASSIGTMSALSAFVLVPFLFSSVSAHIAFFHSSMYGFNVTGETFPYDNRPVAPLMQLPFDKWWFHGHIGYPPHKEDVFELPAGKTVTAELACNKGATSWYASSDGGDIRQGDWPCPGQPSKQFHTTGKDDTKGCALAIAPVADVNAVKPEDFVVFSINQTCVWNRFTNFDVPADMPACPEGGCHCAWFWIHSYDSGSEQNYMNGFQCNVTGARPDAPAISKPQVARRCGADPDHGVPNATPSNCTYGAKAPFYWFQAEGNNMFEGTYAPPYYNDLYNFKNGAQNDIFVTGTSSPTSTTPAPASSTSVTSEPISHPSPSSPAISSSSSTSASYTPTPVPNPGSGNYTTPGVKKSTTTTSTTPTPTPTPTSCRNRPASGNRKHAISSHARRSRARNFGHN